MAYCVHCGVKLEEGVRQCPLCKTPVIDPAEPRREDAPRAYPVRTPEQELKRNKRYLLTWAALLLLLPAALCLVIDALTGGGLNWSIYAAGALVLLFVPTAVSLLVPRNKLYLSMLTSFVCLNGYLFMTEQLSGSDGWFFPIALPAITLGTAMIALITLLYRRDQLNKLTLLGAVLFAVAMQCLGVEWLHSLAQGQGARFLWSPYVVAPCIFVSLAIFFINANRPMREELRRRVHF
ncbi:MAG: zinc ribbon domain-containing protein [Clostridia bacterium]|nr:zinc ribbon domain-containing protein [Clostridia bacterium]